MADVEVQMQFTTTERKVRKVKKTKRRESQDNIIDSEVTITELSRDAEGNQQQTTTTTSNHLAIDQGGEYTKAMSKDWHSGHFSCWQCDESLTGQRYVLRDDHPYCIKCYESVFANVCEECNKIIGIDSKDLSYKEKHWHEACFLCNKCRVSLVDKQFGSKGEKIYCGNCYDSQFASRCDGCGEIFRAASDFNCVPDWSPPKRPEKYSCHIRNTFPLKDASTAEPQTNLRRDWGSGPDPWHIDPPTQGVRRARIAFSRGCWSPNPEVMFGSSPGMQIQGAIKAYCVETCASSFVTNNSKVEDKPE